VTQIIRRLGSRWNLTAGGVERFLGGVEYVFNLGWGWAIRR
jgi:hypothetical protein